MELVVLGISVPNPAWGGREYCWNVEDRGPDRASAIAWMAAIARNGAIDAVRLQAERVSAASQASSRAA